jgi:hypothetical protein
MSSNETPSCSECAGNRNGRYRREQRSVWTTTSGSKAPGTMMPPTRSVTRTPLVTMGRYAPTYVLLSLNRLRITLICKLTDSSDPFFPRCNNVALDSQRMLSTLALTSHSTGACLRLRNHVRLNLQPSRPRWPAKRNHVTSWRQCLRWVLWLTAACAEGLRPVLGRVRRLKRRPQRRRRSFCYS